MTMRTAHAVGTPTSWKWGFSRIMVTMSDSVFADLKRHAIKNNRSVSAEIRHRIEHSLTAEQEVTQ